MISILGVLCEHLGSINFLHCFVSQIGDRNGELTARMNVEQLMETLDVKDGDLSPCGSEFEMQGKEESTACLYKTVQYSLGP